MVELRLERGVVAAPAGHEQQLGIAAARALVVEPDAIEFRVGPAVILTRPIVPFVSASDRVGTVRGDGA